MVLTPPTPMQAAKTTPNTSHWLENGEASTPEPEMQALVGRDRVLGRLLMKGSGVAQNWVSEHPPSHS